MKTTMKHKNQKTIIQQSYNNRSTMKKQLNTRMKHDNEKQNRNTAMTLCNGKQQPYNNETNNEIQE